jgi:hypothetical protein
MAHAPQKKKRRFPVELPGEVKYRPPMGKPEDRMMAIATGRTEDGEKVAVAKLVRLTATAA